jgi:CheY-like chemotaxis protein
MESEIENFNQGVRKLLRLLIVEDDEDKKQDIVDVLVKNGVPKTNIDNENNVQSALQRLKINIYDLVILDLCLPMRCTGGRISTPRNEAGVTILRELQSNSYNIPQQIIGLTSYEPLRSRFKAQFQQLNFYLYQYDLHGEWTSAIGNSIRWLDRGQKNRVRLATKKLAITVHGIRTNGRWQEKLREGIDKSNLMFEYKPFKYPYFSFIKLFTKSKGNALELFKCNLQDLFREHPNSEVYIFAHSFGTYLVHSALSDMKQSECPKIRCLVFAGSVLKSDTKIGDTANRLNIDRVVNDCGSNDLPLLFSECFLKDMGMAGVIGFYGFNSDRFIQRKFKGGHSFFEKDPNFYSTYWLPILNDKIVREGVELISDSDSNKIARYALHNLKYIVWSAIFACFLFVAYLL